MKARWDQINETVKCVWEFPLLTWLLWKNITTGSVKLLDDLGLVESEITPRVGLKNLEQYKT